MGEKPKPSKKRAYRRKLDGNESSRRQKKEMKSG